MSNLIEIIEPAKKKGRPKQFITEEQIQARTAKMKELRKEKSKINKTIEPEDAKPKMKRGIKPKEYKMK